MESTPTMQSHSEPEEEEEFQLFVSPRSRKKKKKQKQKQLLLQIQRHNKGSEQESPLSRTQLFLGNLPPWIQREHILKTFQR